MSEFARQQQARKAAEAAELAAVEPLAGNAVTVLPVELDLTVYEGDTLTIRFTFTDTATPPNPVDMTGTWAAQIRAKANDPDPPVATFTVDSSNASSGIIVATLAATDSRSLTPGTTYAWDIQQTVGTVVRTTHNGTLTTTQDVTRP